MREAPSRYTHPETPFGPQQQRFDSINAKLAGYSQFGCNHQILAACNKKVAGIRALEQEVQMERRQFTREFKLEAVRLIKQRGVSYAQASKDLGVHPTQLRSWVKQLADDPQHAFPGHGQMKPEQLEIAQLKREVAKLKAERDILKKAAAYFAKEST